MPKFMKKPHDKETCTTEGCAMCAKGGGVHEPLGDTAATRGKSKAGSLAREHAELRSEGKYSDAKEVKERAVEHHKDKMDEMELAPKPKFAHGGDVEAEAEDPDEEIHDAIGKEMMDHIHSKNHKGLMESIRAAVALHSMKKDDEHESE